MSKRNREADALVKLIRTVAQKHDEPAANRERRIRFWLTDDAKPYTYFFGASRGSSPAAEYARDFRRWLKRERAFRDLPEIVF